MCIRPPLDVLCWLAASQVAYSREQEEKIYVQHLLGRDAKDLWDLVNGQGACVFFVVDAAVVIVVVVFC